MSQGLTVPPTESEIAALISSLQQFPEHQMVARRMAFQLDRLRERIGYWSYCTSEGMHKTCPEKCNELADFLISLRIAPWYVKLKE